MLITTNENSGNVGVTARLGRAGHIRLNVSPRWHYAFTFAPSMYVMARRSANPRLYRILAVGRDVSRLSSGANILTQAGYTADLALSVDQAVRRVLVRPYHLAIVSSSFSHDEQIAIRGRLQQLRQNLPVLLLGSEHDTPDAFLLAVAHCLKQKKKFHFGTRLEGPTHEHGVD